MYPKTRRAVNCGRFWQPSQKRLVIWGRVSEDAAPLAEGAALRRDQTRHIQAVPTAPSPPPKPKPVQHPVFALVSPNHLATYLASAYRALSRVVRPCDIPRAGDGITAPAASRSDPRACGGESSRRPEPRALQSQKLQVDVEGQLRQQPPYPRLDPASESDQSRRPRSRRRPFRALHANHSLVRAYHGRAVAVCLRRAFRPAS